MNRRALLAAVALVAAIAGYRYWSSNERQIRRLLDGVAEAVSQEEGTAAVSACRGGRRRHGSGQQVRAVGRVEAEGNEGPTNEAS